jgi:hypothetical protein
MWGGCAGSDGLVRERVVRWRERGVREMRGNEIWSDGGRGETEGKEV